MQSVPLWRDLETQRSAADKLHCNTKLQACCRQETANNLCCNVKLDSFRKDLEVTCRDGHTIGCLLYTSPSPRD